MPNLFEITDALWEVVNQAIPDDDDDIKLQGWQDAAIEMLEQDLADKLEDCVKAVKYLDAEAELAKSEAAEFKQKQKSLERRVERLKEYMGTQIMAQDQIVKKVKGKEEKRWPTVQAGAWKTSVQTTPRNFNAELVDVTRVEDRFLRFKEPELEMGVAAKLFRETGEIPKGFEKALNPPRWTVRIR